jgi:acetoin utilization protein AcuB
MSFYIYNDKGFRIPYHPGDKWRQVAGVFEPAAIDERHRDRDQSHPESQEFSQEQEAKKKLKAARITPIIASQIMSHPVTTLPPDALLKEAWELFDKKRFRHIPIMTTDGKIVGILSDRTILHETSEFLHHDEADETRLVKEVMATNVLCAELNTDISQIAKIFVEEHVGAIPIVDTYDSLKGLVTRSDILRTIIKINPPEFQI